MRNSKRWISGAMAAFLLLCAGCGQNSNGADSAAAETEQQQEPVVEQVEDVDMTLPIKNWNDDSSAIQEEEETREGKYTGQLVDGVPNGHGRFDTKNPAGEAWHYEGEFTDGRMTGVGSQVWDDGDYSSLTGHFTDSAFTPTRTEWYQTTIYADTEAFNQQLSLDETTLKMLEDNIDLFPATDDAAKSKAQNFVDSSIEYKHLSKNVVPYRGKLVYFKNQHVEQVRSAMCWGHTYTSILTSNQYGSELQYITYDGDIDVFDGDNITFIAMPYGSSSFENIGGGTTNVITDIASIIIKN